MGSDTSAGHPDRSDVNTSRRAAVPPAARLFRWRRAFKGEERQLRELRRWLASLLPECPACDDVIGVATELASNTLRHTASGRGGFFVAEVTWYRSVVRVAVADEGGPAEPHVIDDPAAERGRGLLLVRGLSVRMGVVGDQRGRLVWADVPWADPAEVGQALADPYEVSIRDGEAALARRFAGVHAWFGRSTLAWWALAGPDELVTAPTARELAGLLFRFQNASPPPRPAAAVQTHPGTVEQATPHRLGRPGVACGTLSPPVPRVPAPASVRLAPARPLAGVLAVGGC
jgi:serine/threonine-protein kinase RsbW